MKLKLVACVMVLSLTMTGCANSVKPISEVKFYPKPSNEEAWAKINGFLSSHLLDPYSAKTKCSFTDKAWIWPGVGYDTQYGYLAICEVNAKNRYGGYVGAEEYIFRFNGPEFEYHKHVPRSGLMEK